MVTFALEEAGSVSRVHKLRVALAPAGRPRSDQDSCTSSGASAVLNTATVSGRVAPAGVEVHTRAEVRAAGRVVTGRLVPFRWLRAMMSRRTSKARSAGS